MAVDPGVGLSAAEVQLALQKCLSLNDKERKQAYDYLSECENNNVFPLVLLECFVVGQRDGNSNLKLQSLIYLKNTISRRWGASTSRHLFKSSPGIFPAALPNDSGGGEREV
ncbi:MAG: importin-beta N-terminal domain-containing protein [Candidatus Pacebacteria bacterium]|nr:importin-beta N-terminal domain-containing protein [Candidatus Paceibacterota bacterium]